jgi:hypothetical protein
MRVTLEVELDDGTKRRSEMPLDCLEDFLSEDFYPVFKMLLDVLRDNCGGSEHRADLLAEMKAAAGLKH